MHSMTTSINSLEYKRETDISVFIIIITCLKSIILRATFCYLVDFKINDNNIKCGSSELSGEIIPKMLKTYHPKQPNLLAQ